VGIDELFIPTFIYLLAIETASSIFWAMFDASKLDGDRQINRWTDRIAAV